MHNNDDYDDNVTNEYYYNDRPNKNTNLKEK